jgi:16S rRNA (guanine966-N2)-methyltransferase
MRIIGGKNKGRKIIPPVDRQTRPLRDIVKESIFNLIEHSNIFKTNINNSKILDLFSG